ncbi:MAG: type VII secretion protein EssC [Clostridia bacterium]|nr:type VII secretion protein EssC [Clostridia bacterium]
MEQKQYSILLQGRMGVRTLTLTDETISPLKMGTKPGVQIDLGPIVGEGELFECALYRSGDHWNFSSAELGFFQDGKPGGATLNRCTVENGLSLSLVSIQGQKMDAVLSVQAHRIFDVTKANLERCVMLRDHQYVKIGGQNGCEVCIKTPVAANEMVHLRNENGVWTLIRSQGDYPVYVNNTRVTSSVRLRPRDFFCVGDALFYFNGDSLYMDAALPIQTQGLTAIMAAAHNPALEYPLFLRSTRVQHQVEMEKIEVLPPSKKAEELKENVLLKTLPPIITLAALIILRGFMGSGSSGTFVLYSVVTMSLSIVVSFFTRADQKKKREEKERTRKERYYAYIQNKIEEIKLRRQDELRILNRIYRSPEDNLNIVRNFDKGLFDRSYQDADFLDVRLGSGEKEAVIQVHTNIPEYKELDDELQDKAQETVDEYKFLSNAPIVARLGDANGMGIIGPRKWLYEFTKVMVSDMMVRQYYKELRLYFVISEEDQQQFSWLRWIKNCEMENTTLRTIMCDDESTKLHLEALYKLLSERESVEEATAWHEHIVVFVYRIDMIRNHPISQYFEMCSRLGVHFVFMDEHEERIPRGSNQMVLLDRLGSNGSLFHVLNGEKKFEFTYTPILDERMGELVSKLCNVHVVESTLEEQMVKNISLYQMLGIQNAKEVDLNSNWSRARIDQTMAAPMGVKSKNAMVSLDLHEKAHGPHGLVAGTTGSGKSELLQTYIISMAAHYHPHEVTFLLIDFKGGGMAKQFRNLPHLAGVITDIDGKEIDRSLKSIRAELERRKALFARFENINKIDDYILLHKKDPVKVPEPLPHLIIVVDEFAELKAEQPEFMKELISAARIGRSLGVHLILATQKPSGVVDAQIWSNSRFRMCLKVATKEDSREMLKTPLAAEIREPGRAYLQVGNDEIFDLFQSAYSGAKVPSADAQRARPFKIHELNMWGKRKLVYEKKAPKRADNSQTESQLDALVSYMHDHCAARGIERLKSICMPPLPQRMAVDTLNMGSHSFENGVVVPVGMYDDPENQDQGSYLMNLTDANTYIMSSSQMGKSTALETILYSAITRYTPEEVNFYIIDSSDSLLAFEHAKHVGDIVHLKEEEKMLNLFRMLTRMMQERKTKLRSFGVGTFRAYLEAGQKDMSQVVLVLDNAATFKEYYEQYDEVLQQISREGASVGISLVVTGNTPNALSYKIMANFGNRITFTCNEEAEYASLMGSRGVKFNPYPGRGLVLMNKRILEAQFALCIDEETVLEQQDGEEKISRSMTDKERSEKLLSALKENAAMYAHVNVPVIPVVPDTLKLADAMQQRPDLFKQPYQMVLGMNYKTVEYETFSLLDQGIMFVTGRAKMGKKNVTRMLLKQIQKNIMLHYTEAYVFDSFKRALNDLNELSCVTEYTTSTETVRQVIAEMYEEITERQEQLYELDDMEEREELLRRWKLKFVIINGEKPWAAINGDKETARKAYEMVAKMAECKVFFLLCDHPNVHVGSLATELAKYVQSGTPFLYMNAMNTIKIMDYSPAVAREFSHVIQTGDAFFYRNSEYVQIKTCRADE